MCNRCEADIRLARAILTQTAYRAQSKNYRTRDKALAELPELKGWLSEAKRLACK